MISIIVPVFNVEPFLEQCINSLIEQTFDDYEIILVDDGSTDKSGRICDEWEKQDDRIRVIHKKNGGLSDARNAGLKIALGKYIAFVDSDDWVHRDYLKKMYESLIATDSDIVECEMIRCSNRNVETGQNTTGQVNSYNNFDAFKSLITEEKFHPYVWNKLYKMSVLKDIIFPVGKTNEDEYWTYKVFANAEKITKITDILYFYYQRNTSIMGSGYSVKRLDGLVARKLRLNYIKNNYPSLLEIANYDLFLSCVYHGQMSLKFLDSNEKYIAIKKIDEIRKNCVNRVHLNDCKTFSEITWWILAKINFWNTCRIKNLLKKGF